MYLPAYMEPDPFKEIIPVEVQIMEPEVRNLPANNTKTGDRFANKTRKLPTKKPSFKIPDVTLPTQDTPDVKIPDFNIKLDNPDAQNVDDKTLNDLAKEAAKPGKGKTQSGSNEYYEKSDFFVVKSLSNVKRKVVRTPARPSFSLRADTKVTLRFKIDRFGNTSNIIPLTRTDSSVERLAVGFVRGMKFAAVSYDKMDVAEIILYFKVK